MILYIYIYAFKHIYIYTYDLRDSSNSISIIPIGYVYIYDGIVCLSLSRQKRRLRRTRQFHNRDGSLACGSFEAYNSWDLCRFTPQHIVVFYPTPSVDWDIMAYTPLTDHVQLASRIMFVALSHVDENDLTATSLELCLLKGIIPRWTEGI